MKTISVVEGDLLDQDVDVIVNSWNRNIIPWWLLLPQGFPGRSSGGVANNHSVKWHGTGRSLWVVLY
jgi:hypothetical protein